MAARPTINIKKVEGIWLWVALLLLATIPFLTDTLFRSHVWAASIPEETARWLEWLIELSGFAIVAFLIILQVLKQKELQRVNQKLQNAREELEVRVEERTEELHKANQWLNHILAANPASIYSAKPRYPYECTFISDSIRAHMGYEPGDVTEDPLFWSTHIHPEDAAQVLEHMAAAVDEGTAVTEYRFLRKDGTYGWVCNQANVVRGSGGGPTEIIGAWLDLTERKQMEQALQESEKRFREFCDLLPQMVFETDKEGAFTFLNRAGQVLRQELSNPIDVLDVVGPEQRDGRTNGWRQLMRGEELVAEERMLTRKDAPSLSVLVYANPIMRDSNFEGVRGVAVDITERKLTEQALISSEMRFQAFMDHSPVLATLKDDRSRFLYANKAWEECFNLSRENYYGKTPGEIWSDERSSLLQENDARVLESNEIIENTATIRDASGKKSHYLTFTFPIEDAVGRRYVGAVISDITQLWKAQQQIKASLGEKEVLLREIHHRVKNNLQVISSMLELQSHFTDGKPVAELLKDAERRVRAMALVHERLYRTANLSRITIDEYLQSIVSHVFAFYGASDSGTVKPELNISTLGFDIDTAIPLGLIVSELVSNCLKHAFPGKRKGIVSINLRSIGKEFELVVADDGVGMPDFIDIGHGGSLGLQLVDSLAAQLHGKIHVLRENGTRVRLTFSGAKVRRRREQ